jgi:16S rRNA (cytosine1402-N4)-methyltransferase
MYHEPVLLKETIELLLVQTGGVYLDGTVGGGGHAAAILDGLNAEGRLLATDRDPEAVAVVQQRFADDSRFQVSQINYSEFFTLFPDYRNSALDGILLDLGVSSHQLDSAERGFSFMRDGALDMRMSVTDSLTAADVVNEYEPEVLRNILIRFGEVRRADRLVDAIVSARQEAPLTTTMQLRRVLEPHLPQHRGFSVLAQIFQALRLEVNRELQALQQFLTAAHDALVPGGRLVVMSYHSLEDRLVKKFFRFAESDCVCSPGSPVCTCDKKQTLKLPVRRAVKPADEEIEANPRARSVRLRVAEKV